MLLWWAEFGGFGATQVLVSNFQDTCWLLLRLTRFPRTGGQIGLFKNGMRQFKGPVSKILQNNNTF